MRLVGIGVVGLVVVLLVLAAIWLIAGRRAPAGATGSWWRTRTVTEHGMTRVELVRTVDDREVQAELFGEVDLRSPDWEREVGDLEARAGERAESLNARGALG
jgi:hypothetical protein